MSAAKITLAFLFFLSMSAAKITSCVSPLNHETTRLELYTICTRPSRPTAKRERKNKQAGKPTTDRAGKNTEHYFCLVGMDVCDPLCYHFSPHEKTLSTTLVWWGWVCVTRRATTSLPTLLSLV